MKKSYFMPLLLLLGVLASSCSKENPFGNESEGEGQFLKSALAMDIKADAFERQGTRAAVEAEPDLFTIIFTRPGNPAPVAKYTYGEMPEVVTLPAGTYVCTATYGENRQAEWESPYFLGASEEFEVKAYEITSYVDPIECHLENVKVTVDFDPMLRAAMSADSYVEVKVGDVSPLNFTLAEADVQKGGFFMHSGETTLVATFNGKIDGVQTSETKTLRDVQKGNHYKITFKLHAGGSGSASGDITGDVSVDASVTVVNVTTDVPLGDEPLLDDSERPSEGGETPDQPKQDPPTITAQAPADIDGVNNADIFGEDLNPLVLNIHSSAEGGIQEFMCVIDSPTLTPDELAGVGLAAELNLAQTPESLAGPLAGLGFPINVRGESDVEFVLTKFMPMLAMLGAAEHHFILTVSDANGSVTKVLKVKTN